MLLKKIKAALHVFLQSLTSIEYYKKLLKTDFGFSLKYYAVLSVIFAVFTAAVALVPLIPKINENINEGIEYALGLYEDDLVITFREGAVSINKEEPYVVSFPMGGSGAPTNLVVFDSEGTLEDLERTYDTLVLVNDANILFRTDSDIRVYPLNQIPDGEITKDDLRAVATQARDWARFVPYILSVLFFIAILFYLLGLRLAYLLLVAAVLWLVGAVRGLDLTYGKYYQVALHSMTLPLLLELFLRFTGTSLEGVPWFLLVNLGFGILVIMGLPLSADSAEDPDGTGDSSEAV